MKKYIFWKIFLAIGMFSSCFMLGISLSNDNTIAAVIFAAFSGTFTYNFITIEE